MICSEKEKVEGEFGQLKNKTAHRLGVAVRIITDR